MRGRATARPKMAGPAGGSSDTMYAQKGTHQVFGDDSPEELLFTIDDPSRPLAIHVVTASGELNVQATDRDDVRVEIEPEGPDEPLVEVAWDGQRLDVRPVQGNGRRWPNRRNADYSVSVEVPARQMAQHGGPGITAELNSASGELAASGLGGRVRINSASGDLSLHDLAGDVVVGTASGSADLDTVRGSLRANTLSGDLSLREAVLGRCLLNSVSGEIDGNVVLAGAGPYDAHSVSGDVALRLALVASERDDDPAHPAGFELTGQTMSGEIDVDGRAEKTARRRWLVGRRGAAMGTIRVVTVSGDVRVQVAEADRDSEIAEPVRRWAATADKTDDAAAKDDPFMGWDTTQAHLDAERAIRDSARVAHNAARVAQDAMGPAMDAARDEIDAALATVRRNLGASAPPAPGRPAPPDVSDKPRPADKVDPVMPTPPSPPTTPAAPSDPAPDQTAKADPVAVDTTDPEAERLRILRQLEAGDLSVEDAMAQLEALPARDGA